MDFSILCPQIEEALLRVRVLYQQVPGLILTESDLKCVLYKELSDIPFLTQPAMTYDCLYATPIHTEVSWFDEQGALTITSDLVILDPRHLRLLEQPLGHEKAMLSRQRVALRREQGARNWQPLPNKKYEFGGTAINFELKFARAGMDRIFKDIQDDHDKIKRLEHVLETNGSHSEVFHYIVIFSRFKNRSNRFSEWVRRCNEEPYIRVIWHHADIWFPGFSRRTTQSTN
ncbi:hypothetical protein [Chloroflexus sp.]|uniref:hypothetical protein n=1 Tax=Chloroflexus sp. TaxID=1904827 RepID=UPI002ACE380B|nr:hypothetical protein [Chloroflexus sp.]